MNFAHYEHQGIALILERDVGGGRVLRIVRKDTQKDLAKIILPESTALLDRRGQ
jgi:hypothetical protein